MRTFRRGILLLALALSSVTWAEVARSALTDSVLKCADYLNSMQAMRIKEDHTQTGHIRLENGMDVALVSNPSAKLAAASVSVGVGFLNDPIGQEGFFHLFEHMMFLGNADSPEVDRLLQFVSGHGGQANAYTALSETNYTLQIVPSFFETSLLLLKQMIAGPLFLDQYLTSELTNVNKEYEDERSERGSHLEAIQQATGDLSHPSARLFQGNHATLKDVTRQDLLDAHRKYYIANNMKLTLMGPAPLSQLQALAEKYFGTLPARPFVAPEYPPITVRAGEAPLVIEWNTPDAGAQLDVVIDLDPTGPEDWTSRSLDVATDILSDQKAGSMISQLKEKGLIQYLKFEASERNESTWSRQIRIRAGLTENGFAHWPALVETLYAQMHFFSQNMLADAVIDESRRTRELSYIFEPFEVSLWTAARTSSWLWVYPQQKVWDLAQLLPLPSAQGVQSIFKLMSEPRRARIYVGSGAHKSSTSRCRSWRLPLRSRPSKKPHFMEQNTRSAP